MSGLLSECDAHFKTTNLYDLFCVDKKCSQTDRECFLFLTISPVRRAFYRLSLKYHPDQVAEKLKVDSTAKFQLISKAYSLLSDEEKRKIYDDTGDVDDENVLSDRTYDDWIDYWRLIFPPISSQQIEEYAAKYKGSKEELDDIATLYTRHKGDMDAVLDNLQLAQSEDEPRLRQLIQSMIDEGRLEAFVLFTDEPKAKKNNRAKRAAKEARLFDKEQKGRKKSKEDGDDLQSLALAIKAKQAVSHESLIDRLTAKYCKPEAKAGKTKSRRK